MKFQISLKVFSVLTAILLSVSFATAQETVTKPYTFSPNTTASAGEVNANFDTLYQKINELSAEIAELKSAGVGTLPAPDYDSDWVFVGTGNTYKKEIGFTGLPKHITAYYKRPNGQVFAWGLTQFDYVNDGREGSHVTGILLDFDDENGYMYIRTPSGNMWNSIMFLRNYRNRTNDGNEYIREDETGLFRVLLWK
jgi:hypothetical protein